MRISHGLEYNVYAVQCGRYWHEYEGCVTYRPCLGTRDHILLSQIWDFPFRRLLRLAGSRAHDQIFTFLWQLGSCFCGAPSLTRGRVCLLYMLLALVSSVFLGPESLGSRDYILLPVLRLPFSSPPTTRRVTVEVFVPASTQVPFNVEAEAEAEAYCWRPAGTLTPGIRTRWDPWQYIFVQC
jgi:hypothetical protein